MKGLSVEMWIYLAAVVALAALMVYIAMRPFSEPGQDIKDIREISLLLFPASFYSVLRAKLFGKRKGFSVATQSGMALLLTVILIFVFIVIATVVVTAIFGWDTISSFLFGG